MQEISGKCDTVLHLANEHAPIVDKTTATMKEIDEIEGEQAAQTREGCYKDAVEEAREYNEGFSNLASSAKNPTTTTTIERELERKPPNFQPLAEYFSSLEQSFVSVKQCYSKFKKSCEDAIAAADRAASANKEKATTSRQRETTTPRQRDAAVAVAGVSAGVAAGVGLGVAASVVAGVFTFGVGALIGLSATAATTAAATTGIIGGAAAGAVGFAGGEAAGTAVAEVAAVLLSANDYERLAVAFDQLKEQYTSLQKTTSTMQDELHHFHLFLEIIRQLLA